MANAISRLRRVARPGSLIFILSDFLSMNHEAEQALTQMARHHDMVGIFISDALEATPPPPNFYAVTDGDAIAGFDSANEDFCKNYRAHFVEHHEYLKSTLRARHIPLIELATDCNAIEILQRYLGNRRLHQRGRERL